MLVLTIRETARLLKRHPTAIRRMVRNGELRGVVRRGGGWVTARSVEELLGAPLGTVVDGRPLIEAPRSDDGREE